MTETNVERLADIKELLIINAVDFNMNQDDVTFLIEQAERAQELEKEIEQTRWDMAELATVEQKLREALEFYAYENNYFVIDMHMESDVHKEGGEIARRVLEVSK